ncbi:hypothetical protein BCR35DRAFT_323300 [Leucosporidium creatinivorum]|uniref:RNA polymerase II-associated protein n=1 Tax=Leucosporidium creatinivorum TaxID=106004 RepID=A0A1Y2G277_9BASI|nr:hypothetical protein BCR35DRAFT_323300 [Leucosporidium creatinivorum]
MAAAPPPTTLDDLEARRTLFVPTGADELALSLDDLSTTDSLVQDDHLVEYMSILSQEKAPLPLWVRLAEELWRLDRFKSALEILDKGTESLPDAHDRAVLLCMKANYNLALARKAPKTVLTRPRGGALHHSTNPSHPESKDPNPENPPLTKDDYWNAAKVLLERAERAAGGEIKVGNDVKAALFLARGALDQASKLFDKILSTEPTNLMALMGRARILFARRSFRPSLKAYQQVLSLAPNHLPDPRIGVGLCFWMMGEKERARRAWERSIVVNPSFSTTPRLLLGLSHLNASKDPTLAGGEDARAQAYKEGIEGISAAFKRDNTLAAATAPLAGHFLLTGKAGTIKLAERTIQFADTRVLLSEGHLAVARALHAQGEEASINEYKLSTDANPDQLIAQLAMAQGWLKNSDFPPAINLYETILRRQPRCLEALVSLASIHTHLAFTYRSSADSLTERKKAKELYDQVLRLFASGKEGGAGKEVNKYVAKSERVRDVARDDEMFVEIARLWSDEGMGERSLTAYKEAARVKEEEGSEEEEGGPSASLLNNIGVLQFQQGKLDDALLSFEGALTEVGTRIGRNGGVVGEKEDAVLVPCTFNRGVVLEALGETAQAVESYETILKSHPEYVEAKARLALIALSTQGKERNAQLDRAHALIKEGLTSNPSHPELRALYTYFLIETSSLKTARDFTLSTLKELNRYDVYALCAAGLVTYLDAREVREPPHEHPEYEKLKKDVSKARHAKFTRAAEYFDKALQLYPQCAFAAQGLAIGIAENTIGTGVEGTALAPAAAQQKNTRDALNILTKVKESVNDGSVYINIGHCHFLREEFERAIENYETAAHRYNKGRSVSALLYLARAWFHKANKDHSFADLQKALESCKAALDLQTSDLASLWNVALVQQKGVEILFGLAPERRTLAEIQLALADCAESQTVFEQLANDPNPNPPYQKGMPSQRHKYGTSLLGRAAAIIETQEAYEATEHAKLNAAKRAREEERARIAAQEEERREEQRRKEEVLAEQRRIMMAEAAEKQWELSQRFEGEEEEEKERKSRKQDKAAGGGGGGKKRSKKSKVDEDASGSEEEEKPKKKKPKAKGKSKKEKDAEDAPADEMDLDEDGEEAVRGGNRRKKGKAFKSTEFISDDSDDE